MSRSLPVYGSLSLPVGEVDLGRRDWRWSHSDTGCGRLHRAHRCACLHCLKWHWLPPAG